MKPKPEPRPTCPCGRVLIREDVSSDARGRLCTYCARSIPTPQPSLEAQRAMSAMQREAAGDYPGIARAAREAMGRIQREQPVRQTRPTSRKPRAMAQEALL